MALAWCCWFIIFPAICYPSYAHEATQLTISELVQSVRPSVVSIYMRGLLDPEQSITANLDREGIRASRNRFHPDRRRIHCDE